MAEEEEENKDRRTFDSHVKHCEGLWLSSECRRFLLPKAKILAMATGMRDEMVTSEGESPRMKNNKRVEIGRKRKRNASAAGKASFVDPPVVAEPEGRGSGSATTESGVAVDPINSSSRPKRERKARIDLDFEYYNKVRPDVEVDDVDVEDGAYRAVFDDYSLADVSTEAWGDDVSPKEAPEWSDSFEKELDVSYTIRKTSNESIEFICRFCSYRTKYKGYMKKHCSLHG